MGVVVHMDAGTRRGTVEVSARWLPIEGGSPMAPQSESFLRVKMI